MKIGIIADTHNRIENVKLAIKVFKSNHVKYIFHAGDFIDEIVVEQFDGLKLFGVFGNNDEKKEKLAKAFTKIGGEFSKDILEKKIDGIKFGMYHGTERKFLNEIIKSGEYDVIIYGHTHRTAIRAAKKCLVLNPGPASGIWNKPSVMIFNTVNKEIKIIYL